jgi:hypothetical protein
MQSGSEKGGTEEASAAPRHLGTAGRSSDKVARGLQVSDQRQSRNLRPGKAASTTRSLPSRPGEALTARLPPPLLLRRKCRHRGETAGAVVVAEARKKTGLQGARTSRKSRIGRGARRDAGIAFELFRESLREHKRGVRFARVSLEDLGGKAQTPHLR